jgi:hypothetical protein
MKKLILITGVFFSASLWASPKDTICRVNAGDSGYNADEFILENCERNNIIQFIDLDVDSIPWIVSEWCRYDRNVTETIEPSITPVASVTCVLYDNKRRNEVINY